MRVFVLFILVLRSISINAQSSIKLEERLKMRINDLAPLFNGVIFAAKLRSCVNYEEKVFSKATVKHKNSKLKMLLVLPSTEPDTLLLRALEGCISESFKKFTELLYNDALFNDLNNQNITYVQKLGNNYEFHFRDGSINSTERDVFQGNSNLDTTKTNKNDSIYTIRDEWNISYARYGTGYQIIRDQNSLYLWQNTSTTIRKFNIESKTTSSIDMKPLLFDVRNQFFKRNNLTIDSMGLSNGDNLEIEILNFRMKDTFLHIDFLIKNPKNRKVLGPRNTLLGAVYTKSYHLLGWFLPSRSKVYSQNSFMSNVVDNKLVLEVLPPASTKTGDRKYLLTGMIVDNQLKITDTLNNLSIPNHVYNKFGSMPDYTDPKFRTIDSKKGKELFYPTTFPLIFNAKGIVFKSSLFDYKPKTYLSTVSIKEVKNGMKAIYYVDNSRGIKTENIDLNFNSVSTSDFVLPSFKGKNISNMIEHNNHGYMVTSFSSDAIHEVHRLIEFVLK